MRIFGLFQPVCSQRYPIMSLQQALQPQHSQARLAACTESSATICVLQRIISALQPELGLFLDFLVWHCSSCSMPKCCTPCSSQACCASLYRAHVFDACVWLSCAYRSKFAGPVALCDQVASYRSSASPFGLADLHREQRS